MYEMTELEERLEDLKQMKIRLEVMMEQAIHLGVELDIPALEQEIAVCESALGEAEEEEMREMNRAYERSVL